VDQRWL